MVAGPIAVTGGTGFVGSHLVERLCETGLDVRLLARAPEKTQALPVSDIVTGDLRERRALERLCAGAHSVIHCAGTITAGSRGGYDKVNVDGTRALVQTARAAGVKNFILISTMAAREPDLSDYGASKRQGEIALRQEAGDMVWSILRPPPVYGPRDKSTLPLFKMLAGKIALMPARRDGRISVIHVTDLADVIIRLIEDAPTQSDIYEVHDGREHGYSWSDLAAAAGESEGHCAKIVFLPRALANLAGRYGQAIAMLTGRAPMVTPGKIRQMYHPDWVAQHNLIDRYIDWTPGIGFAEGFKRTVAWYREAGWM